MDFIQFTILPPTEALGGYVEYFRIAEYAGSDGLSIKVCPNGFPGIVFQHSNGQPAIENITVSSGRTVQMPSTLFLYGQVTELSVMNFKRAPYTTVQAILKPHALRTLFGMDASGLTNASIACADFDAESLNMRLLAAKSNRDYVALLEDFLLQRLGTTQSRDVLVEECLAYIDANIDVVTVKNLTEKVHLSQRQLEKRFVHTVGISPQFFVRVKRFNEAMRLINSGQYDRLSDVAYALNYFDQSHFIRDIKVFSGITPKSISQKVNDFHHDQIGSSYLLG